MKKNSPFQLSAAWWRTEGPECLPSGKDLDKALSAYESALKQLEKTGDDKALAGVDKPLDEIETLVRKLTGEADKLLKSPPKDPKKAKFDADEVQFTVDALRKAGKVIDAARQSAQALVQADDEEDGAEEDEDKSALSDEKTYRTYLTRLLKMAAKDTLYYAIALAKKPGDSRMLLHRTRSGKSLAATLRKETDLKKIAFGECVADADDPTTLQMLIEGTPVSGLGRSTERLFHAFKPQPFKKVVLYAGGEVVEDAIDPDDLPDEYQAIKAELYPDLSAAVREGVHNKDEIVRLMGLADKAAKAGDFAEGIRLYEELRGLLAQARQKPEGGPGGQGAGSSQPTHDVNAALAFNERLRGLMGAIKAGGPGLAKLATDAGILARGQNFEAANARLDEIERLVKASVEPVQPKSGSEAGEAFTGRLKGLLSRIQAAAGTPAGDQARLKASEAGIAARKQQFDQAQALLDEVEALLDGRSEAQARQESAPSPGGGANVAYTQARLAWDQTRKKVQAELRKLEAAILETCQDDPELDQIAAGTKNLYEMLEVLDDSLIDKLDDALNAEDPARRKALHDEAREIAQGYTDFIESEPLMQDIDRNGFIDVEIASSLKEALATIDQRLKALA